MKYLVAGVYLPDSEFHKKTNVLIEDGVIVSLSANMDDHMDARVISLDDCCLFPGFTDVHVHFREPGFSYKETILTGVLSEKRPVSRFCLTAASPWRKKVRSSRIWMEWLPESWHFPMTDTVFRMTG